VSAVKIVIVATILCLSPLNAQTASIQVTDVQRNELSSIPAGQVTISCTTNYNPTLCLAGANRLAKVLQHYPTSRLGEWRFVLASSEHWEQIIKALGGDPESPAFTELTAHVTVLEDALFETTDLRRAGLAQRYGQTVSGLLDYAISHEIGHAICREHDERLAEAYGRDLRMGTTPVCGLGQ
jgi:hypothetical protein